MSTFKVYEYQTSKKKKYEVVKKGFAWDAFFFAPLWALFYQLWLPLMAFSLILLVTFLLIILAKELTSPLQEVVVISIRFIVIATSLTFGFLGNSWRISSLNKKEKYKFIGDVKAWTPQKAIKMIESQ